MLRNAAWLGLSLVIAIAFVGSRTGAASAPAPGRPVAGSLPGTDLLPKIDHLVYATPNLERGIKEIEQALGVRATLGAKTGPRRNALVSLGPSMFLEILAPAPNQPESSPVRLQHMSSSRLATWAVKETGLDRLRSESAAKGMPLTVIRKGESDLPGGQHLSWQSVSAGRVVMQGISLLPFFINWTTPNPSESAAQGATLVGLRAVHPDPEAEQRLIQRFGLNLPIEKGPEPALVAIIDCPRGRVELR